MTANSILIANSGSMASRIWLRAVCGGAVLAYHAPISSTLVARHARLWALWSGLIVALMFLLTLFFRQRQYSHLFQAFVSRWACIIYFGLQFMKEWLIDSWSKLPRQDYIVIVVIALVDWAIRLIAWLSLVGVVVAISFFVLEYSRMEVIKHELLRQQSIAAISTALSRRTSCCKIEGDRDIDLCACRATSFLAPLIAFTNISNLGSRLTEGGRLRFIILDFTSVRGL